ncbi:MAG: flagellar motor switch protein FliM [Aquabacterium sp.]|nr:flagellar motor switch protein FliM [Aquabacterium sp.]
MSDPTTPTPIPVPPPAAPPAEPTLSVFDKMNRVVRRRMPTLELIHERFARTARLTLYNMVRCAVEVDVKLPEIKPYAAFVNGFPERTNINLVNIRPLRGVGCWIIDPQVVYITIDNMFGGEGKLPPKISSKEYTAIELRIIRRLVDSLLAEYEKAWKPAFEIHFDFLRQETSFQFARITDNEEMVLHCGFTVDINGRQGSVDLCIPFWVLEPIKTLLFSQMQTFQADEDSTWSDNLRSELQSAQVQLVAVLARRNSTLGEVLSFNVGDLLPIELQDPVTVLVDGLPMIKGAYGVRNGRYAVKVGEIEHPIAFGNRPPDRGVMSPLYRERPETGAAPSPQRDLP